MNKGRICAEPIGHSANLGTVVCTLEDGHDGEHNGGEREKQLKDEVSAYFADEGGTQ